MTTARAPGVASIELPAVAEQKALVEGYTAAWPGGFRAWARGLMIRQERGGFRPWQDFGWHKEYDRKLALMSERLNQWFFILKARKRGGSVKLVAGALHEAMWGWPSAQLYVTWHEDAAYGTEDSVQERMALMYRSLPEWQRGLCPVVKCPVGDFGTQGEVVIRRLWTEGGVTESRIEIRTASPSVGAHEDFSKVILDEVARYESPERVKSSVEPSVTRSGGPIIACTALHDDNHPGSWIWRQFEAARRGAIDAEWMFVGFGSRPDDDWAVREQKRKDAEATGELVGFYKEYCETVEEALMGTGTGLADLQSLAACHENRPPLPLPAALAEYA